MSRRPTAKYLARVEAERRKVDASIVKRDDTPDEIARVQRQIENVDAKAAKAQADAAQAKADAARVEGSTQAIGTTLGSMVAALDASTRKASITLIGEVKPRFGGVLSVNLGVRRAIMDLPGLAAGDVVAFVPRALMPAGFVCVQCYCVDAGKLVMDFITPPLAVAVVTEIPMLIYSIRPRMT